MVNDKRNRRTQEEMLAHYQAEVAKLEAKIEGRYEDDGGTDMVKALKARLRKTTTALRAAQIMINGVVKADGKGWQRAPISEKIAGTRTRLMQQEDGENFATVQIIKLPDDVSRLTLLLEAATAGEDVEFPENLTPLSMKDTERSDDQIEADFIASEEHAEVS